MKSKTLLVLNDKKVIVNRVKVPIGWSGKGKEWKIPKGCTVEEDVGQKYEEAPHPQLFEEAKTKAQEILMDFVGTLPNCPPEIKHFLDLKSRKKD